MCFLPSKFSYYPSRPVPVPKLFGKYPTRPVPKSKTPTRRSLPMSRYPTRKTIVFLAAIACINALGSGSCLFVRSFVNMLKNLKIALF